MSHHKLDWDLIGSFRICIFLLEKSSLQFGGPNPVHTHDLNLTLYLEAPGPDSMMFDGLVSERWNKRIVSIIEDRLAAFPAWHPLDFDQRLPGDLDYDKAFIPACWTMQPPSIEELRIEVPPPSRHPPTAAHHAMHIPELLHMVMRYADLETRLVAWQVSRLWRRSAEPLIYPELQKQYCRTWPYKPVQYGDKLSMAEAKLCAPSHEETSHLCDAFFHDHPTNYITPSPNYFPSRFVQRRIYRPAILSQIAPANHRLFLEHQARSPMRYLDLSRLVFNPFLLAALSPRAHTHYGRLDIELRPATSSLDMILASHLITPSLWAFLAPKQITYPPCSCLGIYAVETCDVAPIRDPPETHLQLLARIRNPDGIRIEELVAELNKQAPRALGMWRQGAMQMRADIAAGRWADPAWCVRGTPRLTLLLNRVDMLDGGQGVGVQGFSSAGYQRQFGGYRVRDSRWEYVRAENVLGARMSEWVGEEVMGEFVGEVRAYAGDWERIEEAFRRVDWGLGGVYRGLGPHWWMIWYVYRRRWERRGGRSEGCE